MKVAKVLRDDKGNLRWVDQETNQVIPGSKKTYDPSRGENVYGDFEFGHKDDHKWADYQDDMSNWSKTREQIIEEQNDVSKYQIEWKSNNARKGAQDAVRRKGNGKATKESHSNVRYLHKTE